MELYNRGYMYDTALSYYIAPAEEAVEAYFTEHESDYAEAGITRSSGKLVDIRHILLIPQVPEDGTGTVTVAPDGTVTCSEELWDACLDLRPDAGGGLRESFGSGQQARRQQIHQ